MVFFNDKSFFFSVQFLFLVRQTTMEQAKSVFVLFSLLALLFRGQEGSPRSKNNIRNREERRKELKTKLQRLKNGLLLLKIPLFSYIALIMQKSY